MTTYSFDRAVAYYDQTYGWSPVVAGRAAAAVAAALGVQRWEPVLEVGVGSGRLAIPLVRRPHKLNYYGCDLSMAMMRRIEEQQRTNLQAGELYVWNTQADITRLPYHAAAFAGVVAAQVFHLLPDLPAALTEIKRVLQAGRPLIVVNDAVPDGPDMRGTINNQMYHYLLAEGYVDKEQQPGITEVTAAIKAAGAKQVEVIEAFRWALSISPRQFYQQLVARQPSKLWAVPEDIFQRASLQLWHWLEQEYAGRLDVPIANQRTFVIRKATF